MKPIFLGDFARLGKDGFLLREDVAKRTPIDIVGAMNATLTSEIARLTADEKFALMEDLWDDLSENENTLPIPAWHKALLAEDQARYNTNPTEGSPWSEVKARITRNS